MSNVDGKAYRLTCILILLIVFSSVYIEAMTFVFNHQKQAKMKSKNLMKPTAEEMSISKDWSSRFFSSDMSNLAFTFSYGFCCFLLYLLHPAKFTDSL